MTFTSCSEEAFDTDSVNKQTILVYYPWTGSTSSIGLLNYLQNNIDSICDGIIEKKGLNNSRVLVFLSKKYNQSTLYDLQYDATTKSVNRVSLKEYEGTSYATAEGFADILNEVKTQASALNYALIVGVHGCGWTYAEDWGNYPYYARPAIGSNSGSDNSGSSYSAAGYSAASSTPASFSGIQFGNNPDAPLTRFFGSVSLKESATDISTLAEGIKQSGLKMQYILFDACYMSNVETAYELKDVTNYMIASGSEIMAAGLPYRSMWSYLNSPTPNYSGIVSTSVNFYKNNSSAPFCNLAAIDCRQVEKLASVMKDINAENQLQASVNLDSIQHLDGFRPNLFYDLETYVDSLRPSGYLLDQFKSQLKLTIKASDHTDEAYTCIYSSDSFKIKNYCGITISDPSQHSVAIKGREKTGWWKATH